MENDFILPPPPCERDCPDRSDVCHIHCERYNEWKALKKKANERRRREEERYAVSDTKRKWMYQKQKRNKFSRKDTTRY